MTGLADVVPAIAGRDESEGLVVATVIADRSRLGLTPGRRLLVRERGPVMGSLDPRLDPPAIEGARAALSARRSRVVSYRVGENLVEAVGIQGGDLELFFEVLACPPRLIIAGAGHIAQPLAEIAALAGFQVTVVDDRAEYASARRFPHAAELLIGPYQKLMHSLPIDEDTYVVLVTRGHVHDRACLEVVIRTPAAYIGMIGSKRRVRTVLDRLAEDGVGAETLERVHAPIGLDIGAETPAEIAVAIMAEMIKVRRGGTGRSLTAGRKPGARVRA